MIGSILRRKKTAAILISVSLVVGVIGFWDPMTDYALAQISHVPTLPPTTCGASGTLLHVDKIMFNPTRKLFHATEDPLRAGFAYDIKVVDDPTTVKYAREEVVGFLNSASYKVNPGLTLPIQLWHVFVFDIDYDMECLPGP